MIYHKRRFRFRQLLPWACVVGVALFSCCGKPLRDEECLGKFLLVEVVSPENEASAMQQNKPSPCVLSEDTAERFFVIKPGGVVEFHNLRWEDVREKFHRHEEQTGPLPSAGAWRLEQKTETLKNLRKARWISMCGAGSKTTLLHGAEEIEHFIFGGYMIREQNEVWFWLPVGDPDLWLFTIFQKVADEDESSVSLDRR
ncbi:MAG: hypothetical protein J5654_07465 [Victivallales bacterium]|nr:hypothetical protein [Victivallales bacterium]